MILSSKKVLASNSFRLTLVWFIDRVLRMQVTILLKEFLRTSQHDSNK